VSDSLQFTAECYCVLCIWDVPGFILEALKLILEEVDQTHIPP